MLRQWGPKDTPTGQDDDSAKIKTARRAAIKY